MARKILNRIGRCIYCGSRRDLTSEHIIPYGLGGEFILQEASCKKCATITSQFEGDELKGPLSAFRAANKFPSRHKKIRPINFQLKAKKSGENQSFTISAQPTLFPLMLPIYDVPAFINKHPYVSGLTIKDIVLWYNQDEMYKFMKKEEV